MGQGTDESVELGGGVLAGDDDAEVSIRRPTEIIDVRRVDAAGTQAFFECVHLARITRDDRNDRSGAVVDGKVSFAKDGFDVAGVEDETTAHV